MVAGPLGALPPLVQACRPRQWPKNLLVFAAPLFAFRFDADVWLKAGGALVAFCLISSAIYLLNDCLDVAADRAHPSKRYRPIAAGQLSVPAALTTAAVLAVVSLSLAAWITPALAGVVLLYGLIQVGYCFQLKRMPLLDLFCIASGFLLRAIAGVVAGGFGFSPWFLLTVGLQGFTAPSLARRLGLVLEPEATANDAQGEGPMTGVPSQTDEAKGPAPQAESGVINP